MCTERGTALKGQPLNGVLPWFGEGSLTLCGVSLSHCRARGGFCPGKMGGRRDRQPSKAGTPPLSPGSPSSRSVQAWLGKIRKEGWRAGLVLSRGVSFRGSPSQGRGLETLRSQQQLPGRSLAKALTAFGGSAPPWSPVEPDPTWGWKAGHPCYRPLLGMQI